jgi:hypothetical protein
MNERIEHCLYQAGLTAQGCWEDLDTYTQEGIEKFAELIVKECANAIVNDSRLSDVRTARNGCVRTIKEHFGVES